MRGHFDDLIPINTSNPNPHIVVMSHSVDADLGVIQEVSQISNIDFQDFQPSSSTDSCSLRPRYHKVTVFFNFVVNADGL